ncbi:MAG: hypothetical protein GY722_24250 [bacterium]|nr:hypothetical protein [bacterium]
MGRELTKWRIKLLEKCHDRLLTGSDISDIKLMLLTIGRMIADLEEDDE